MRKKISLTNLSKKEMRETKAGAVELPEICITPNCSCACCYANSGGSSTSVNCSANHLTGLHSDCDPTQGTD